MDEAPATKIPLKLKGWPRAIAFIFGALLLVFPIALYLEARVGLFAPAGEGIAGFELVFGAVAVVGGALLYSALLGRWLILRDLEVVDGDAPDEEGVVSVQGARSTPTISTVDLAAEPPQFEGDFTGPIDFGLADPRFVAVARAHFEERSDRDETFEKSLVSIYRSAKGRPNWYFHLRTKGSESSWVRVPHAGRAGAGAGRVKD